MWPVLYQSSRLPSPSNEFPMDFSSSGLQRKPLSHLPGALCQRAVVKHICGCVNMHVCDCMHVLCLKMHGSTCACVCFLWGCALMCEACFECVCPQLCMRETIQLVGACLACTCFGMYTLEACTHVCMHEGTCAYACVLWMWGIMSVCTREFVYACVCVHLYA